MAKSKKNTTQRFGAAALATATVVSGLAFGPGAVAAPAPAITTTNQNGDPAASTGPSIDAGAFSPVLRPRVDLSIGLQHVVRVSTYTTRHVTSLDSKVVFTAPAGTTFPDASNRSVRYKKPGMTDWATSAYLVLTNGVLSADAKTVTYDADASSGSFDMPRDTQLEFATVLTVPESALPQSGLALTMRHSGGASTGAFDVTTSAPVTLVMESEAFSPIEVPSVHLPAGRETAVKVVVRSNNWTWMRTPRLVLTAPEGTTFPEQTIATGRVKPHSADHFSDQPMLDMLNGVVSDGGKTLTFTGHRGSAGNPELLAGPGTQHEHTVKVVADEEASGSSSSSVGFSFSGRGDEGQFMVTGAAPVTIADFGSISASEVDATELERGTDTEVSAVVEASTALSTLDSTVVLTAPAGTTFANADDRTVAYQRPGGQWTPSTTLELTGGVLSDDARTLTYDADVSRDIALEAGSKLKFSATVSTPVDAVDADGLAMSFVHAGTSNSGAFHATGAAPVSVVGDFGHLTASPVEAVEAVRGTVVQVPAQFENVSRTNVRGAVEGTVTVTAPEGTTFVEGQTAVPFHYKTGVAGSWQAYDRMDLAGVTLSEDGRTMTATVSTADAKLDGDERYRYMFSVEVSDDAPETGELAFAFENSAPENRFRVSTTTPVSTVSAYTDVTLDNVADGDTFTPGDVTFSGTGTPGATVTVAPATGPGVSTEVRPDGTWTAVRYLGNAAYTMSVTQVAASGENKVENIRLFSDAAVEQAFSVTSPATGDGHTQQGWVTFTGQGTTWSTVSISDGTSAAPTRATVQYDGSWTARRWVGTEKTTFTVTSSRADVQNGSQTIEYNTGVSGQAFSLDSHTDGGTFTPGNVVFRGKGSTGDKVTFTAPGLAPLEATVNAAGEWSIPRWLGNGFITFTVTHTPVSGDETEQTLRLFSDQVAQGELTVTSPLDGAGHDQQGWVTFTGTGTTWSTISISDGTSAAPSKATVQYDGSWTVNRWVGTSATTFTVTSERAGVANGSETIEFNVGDAVDDFTIGSHTDGGTFTPGNVAITGTGSTGDKVTITAPGLAPLETEVDGRGRWSVQRWLGNGFITFTVTHTPKDGAETEQTLRLFSDQVAQGELTVTSPVDGASHAEQGWVTFTGTGTTWSKVSVSDGTSAAPSTATVQYDGSWTLRRWVGTAPVTFTVTSQRADIANGSTTIRFNTAD
jgi:hypothetical protein